MRKAKDKICLIYTGGTITMLKSEEGFFNLRENLNTFLDFSHDSLRGVVEFDFVELLNKDSTNVTPNDWTKIAKTVYDKRDEGYKGFVIVHGTDTIHFSATALAFALGNNLNFPVVFTGSQAVASVKHGDARINLIRAVMVALTDIAEVVVSFGDKVFWACRTQKKVGSVLMLMSLRYFILWRRLRKIL